MDELTQQKADLKASIADREIARGFHLQKSHIAFYLRSLRDADWSDKEAQKRLIQTFVNAVCIYDDHITLTYNFSGDKSTITLRDMQRFEDGEEFGCRASRSTKAEPDEPRGRLALLLSLQSIWSAESSFWSVRSTRKNKKEATAQDCSCAVASLCFFHSHNGFRYNLPKSSEILKSLLESTVKEHGYD